MSTGNVQYDSPEDLPDVIPVFPLESVMLLPRAQLPLNIFEPRYVAMIDHALTSERLIGIVQPALAGCSSVPSEHSGEPDLCSIGCVGRLVGFQESGDGRYLITLTGISRFRVVREMPTMSDFRMCHITTEPFSDDFDTNSLDEATVDRAALLATFKSYLDANELETDWDDVAQATTESLVNALSMMAPYGAAEKQALLEAKTLKIRSDTLVALTEISLNKMQGGSSSSLQ